MQVDLSANSLTRDAKLLLKSAAQAANCTLMLDDSETVERQERKEREEVDTVEKQGLEGQKGPATTAVMPSGAEAGAPALHPCPSSASLLIPASATASATASISAHNPYGTYTADTARPHMKKSLSPRVSLVAVRKKRFESLSVTPNADYDA